MEKAKMDRISELSRKSKTVGLTPEEKEEQRVLREEYISSFRNNLKSTLDTIVVVDKHGNKTKLKKKESTSH